MPYRTSRTTPFTPPALPGEWRCYYPHFNPDLGVEVLVGARNGAVDDYTHSSNGSWDGTRQSCFSEYNDGTNRRSQVVVDRIFSHYEKVSGAPVEKLRGYITHYDTTTKELVFMLEKSTTNYQVNIRATGQ